MATTGTSVQVGCGRRAHTVLGVGKPQWRRRDAGRRLYFHCRDDLRISISNRPSSGGANGWLSKSPRPWTAGTAASSGSVKAVDAGGRRAPAACSATPITVFGGMKRDYHMLRRLLPGLTPILGWLLGAASSPRRRRRLRPRPPHPEFVQQVDCRRFGCCRPAQRKFQAFDTLARSPRCAI
jgi:hypothetical protein